MPNYKGHLFGGILFYSVVLFCCMSSLKTSTLFEWLFFVCVGALFPDIDTKSKGQRFFFALFAALLVFLLVQQKVYAALLLAIAACAPLIAHHRGLFHNFWFLTFFIATICIICAYLLPAYRTIIMYDAFFFWLGVFSHLVLDRGLRKLW